MTKLVEPYLATGEAHFFGVLRILAMLVPEAFNSEEDRFWYQSLALDTASFGNMASQALLLAGRGAKARLLVNNILLHQARASIRAGLLWLDLNPDSELPPVLIRLAFRSIQNRGKQSIAHQLFSECHKRLGGDMWLRFARWLLTTGDQMVAVGAAIVLWDSGNADYPFLAMSS